MVTATTETGLTARTVLLGGSTEDDVAVLRNALSEHGVIGQCGGDLARLTLQARDAADDTLASVAAGLLNIDLGDVLIYGWRTHDRLVKAAKVTLHAPGRKEVVQLGCHQVTWTKNPTVDLLVDGFRVHTFRFQVTVVFHVDIATAVVQEGKLTALKAGDGSVTGTLTLAMPGGDLQLVQQERKINLHLLVHLGSGIPLLRAEPDSAAAGEKTAAAGEETTGVEDTQ